MKLRRIHVLGKALILIITLLPAAFFTSFADAAESTPSSYANQTQDGTIEIPVRKKLTGSTPGTPETFSFLLSAADRAPMPEDSVNEEKTIKINGAEYTTFGMIRYTEIGEYHYTITEIPGKNSRCIYDTTVYSAIVQVNWESSVGGKLQASLYLIKNGGTEKQEEVLFINAYQKGSAVTPGPSEPGSSSEPSSGPSQPPSSSQTSSSQPRSETGSVAVHPLIRKIVRGNPENPAAFTFHFVAEDKIFPMPSGSAEGVKSVSVTGQGTIDVGSILYTQPGVYRYTVSEENDKLAGYTYDRTVYTMTVTVAKGKDGLQAFPRVVRSDGTIAAGLSFMNEYKGNSGSPQTGDSTNLYFWLLLGAASFAGLLFIFLWKRPGKPKQ